MLTFEQNRWNFKAIEIYSALNFFPFQFIMKTGKIQRRSNKIRIFLWCLLFFLAILHSVYVLGRLVQSTLIEPEMYFRWDHFVIHLPFLVGYLVMSYTGFCVFVKNPEECVIIFNQLFVERENAVQKMMDQGQRFRFKREGRKTKKDTTRANSGDWIELEAISGSASAPDPDQTQDLDSDRQKTCESANRAGVRPLLSWPLQYSLDELLTRLLSPLCEISKLFMLVIFAVDPSRPQLLYSFLPPEFQNLYSFLALLAVEGIFATVAEFLAWFSILCQLLFFSKCQAEFKRLELQLRNLKETFQNRPIQNRDIRREKLILRQILKEMKELEVFVELFNRCFPLCIFAFKLLCFSVSTLFYFFTIRHFHEFPFLALFTGYIAVAMTLVYGILYQKAFSIPQKMELLKNDFLVSVHKSTSTTNANDENRSFRAEMKREIEGIRDVGIKVGSFYTLERQSTPNFVDFVVKNVVNLLVTFPQ